METGSELMFSESVTVIHKSKFIDTICNVALDKRVTIRVDAHLENNFVFHVHFIPVDRNTVEVKLPEMDKV